MPADIGAHGVVRLLAPVEREHEREVVFVEPRDVRLVQEHAVRRQRELEFLARLLLALSHILGDRLDRLHVQERLTAEKVDLAMPARPRPLNEEVHGAAAHLGHHDGAFHAVVAAVAEAIFAAQIAVLRDHQTQRLHEPLLGKGRRHVDVGGEKLAALHELVQLLQGFFEFCRRMLRGERVHDRAVVRAVEDVQDVADHLVDDMDGTAVDVQQDEAVRLLELVYLLFHISSAV